LLKLSLLCTLLVICCEAPPTIMDVGLYEIKHIIIITHVELAMTCVPLVVCIQGWHFTHVDWEVARDIARVGVTQ